MSGSVMFLFPGCQPSAAGVGGRSPQDSDKPGRFLLPASEDRKRQGCCGRIRPGAGSVTQRKNLQPSVPGHFSPQFALCSFDL